MDFTSNLNPFPTLHPPTNQDSILTLARRRFARSIFKRRKNSPSIASRRDFPDGIFNGVCA